jgi:hypothetical protein
VRNLFNLFQHRSHSIENEIDEELRFHIDMQTSAYEDGGHSLRESLEMANARFGNVENVRRECLRISSGKSVLIWLLNTVFLLSLLVGLLLKVFVPEVHINQVGNVLMMIGTLGILLVYAKQAGASVYRSTGKTFRLGLQNTPPLSFDEKGRTPFDRVRADD